MACLAAWRALRIIKVLRLKAERALEMEAWIYACWAYRAASRAWGCNRVFPLLRMLNSVWLPPIAAAPRHLASGPSVVAEHRGTGALE